MPGIASMGPRSADRGNGVQRTHDGYQLKVASMGPRSADRGNPQPARPSTRRTPASMGPRSADRGNGTVDEFFDDLCERFNGAAISRSRKSKDRRRPQETGTSFNGAAISRSRKYAFREGCRRLHGELQWGRDQQIAEMGTAPAQFSTANGFNGAAISRSRKYQTSP